MFLVSDPLACAVSLAASFSARAMAELRILALSSSLMVSHRSATCCLVKANPGFFAHGLANASDWSQEQVEWHAS